MLCYACGMPLLDEQPYERVYSAEHPYRHADAADCPALRDGRRRADLPPGDTPSSTRDD